MCVLSRDDYSGERNCLLIGGPVYQGGRTALHVCALRGHAPCLKVILQNDREFQRNPNSPVREVAEVPEPGRSLPWADC